MTLGYHARTLLLVVSIAVYSCCALPDLEIRSIDVERSLSLSTLTNPDPCLLGHECLSTLDSPLLLRFDTKVYNAAPPPPPGTLDNDFVLGRPEDAGVTPSNYSWSDTWEWHGCHGHWHYLHFAEYELVDLTLSAQQEQEVIVVRAGKVSFCIIDVGCLRPGAKAKYDCGNQGLTPGCFDVYNYRVACQWVDMTNLPLDHRYKLRIIIDPSNKVPEIEDFSNNVAEVEFVPNDVPDRSLTRTKLAFSFVFVPAFLFLFYFVAY